MATIAEDAQLTASTAKVVAEKAAAHIAALEQLYVIEQVKGWNAPIEIKLGDNKVPEAIATLDCLRRKVASNPAARNPRPAFSAVLVGAGEHARHDEASDVCIIPLTVLGA